MLAVPAPPPVTIPDVPTDAVKGALLLHVPPAVASVSAVVDPTQTLGEPVIMVIGVMFTETDLAQPEGTA